MLTTFIWGSTFVIVKGALEDASALSFVAVRFTLAGVLLLVLLARLRIDPKALLPATVLGVCEVGHRDLAWQPFGELVGIVESVRADLPEALRTTGETRAEAMGLREGLDWVRRLALGEP